ELHDAIGVRHSRLRLALRDVTKRGLTSHVSGPDHASVDATPLEPTLQLTAPDPGLGVDDDREHVPPGLDACGETRQREQARPTSEMLGCQLEVALPPAEIVSELVELDETERRRKLGRLEVPSDLVEDEQVVVLEFAVDIAEEPTVDTSA